MNHSESNVVKYYCNESRRSWESYFRSRSFYRQFLEEEDVRYLTDAKAVRRANQALNHVLDVEVVRCLENRDVRRRIRQVTDLLLDDPAQWPVVVPLAARKILMILDLYGTEDLGADIPGKAPQWEVALLVAMASLCDVPPRGPDIEPAPEAVPDPEPAPEGPVLN